MHACADDEIKRMQLADRVRGAVGHVASMSGNVGAARVGSGRRQSARRPRGIRPGLPRSNAGAVAGRWAVTRSNTSSLPRLRAQDDSAAGTSTPQARAVRPAAYGVMPVAVTPPARFKRPPVAVTLQVGDLLTSESVAHRARQFPPVVVGPSMAVFRR